MINKNKVVVITSGGIVTYVYSTIDDLEVDIIDCDDLKEEDVKNINGYIDDKTEDMYIVY